jgi:YXWGXW repeat-containing protein
MRRLPTVFLLLSVLTVMAAPTASVAQIISITIAPPELPVYVQPPIPARGYIWTPGYWAYSPDGYYWVPGTWVEPPSVGLLWTPGYWGWRDGIYLFNAGYWGPRIGFYGGVNYGFGYGGVGYEGGYWNNGVFAYNRTVNNFGGVAITNVYNKTVINNTTVTRVSFNGGAGGTKAQPTPQEEAVAHEQHVAATPVQTQHEHAASTNKALLASVNNGHPAIAATSKPGEFTGKGVVAAREAKPATTLPNTTLPSTKLPSAAPPTGVGALDKKGPAGKLAPLGADRKPIDTGKEHATIERGTPKALTTTPTSKPITAAPPLRAAAPSPPPHAAAPPPVAAAPRPAAKPTAPPHGDPNKKPPPG